MTAADRLGQQCGWRLFLTLSFIQLVSAVEYTSATPLKQNSTQAYVTLLYGDDFLLGVRVLGESLKESGTLRCVLYLLDHRKLDVPAQTSPFTWLTFCRDRVVLAAGDVSEYATLTLQADGWLVHKVEAVNNPSMRDDGKFPTRFWAVYSKLHVFGLTEYEKGVLLHVCGQLHCVCFGSVIRSDGVFHVQ